MTDLKAARITGLLLLAMLIVAASGCQTDRNGMTVDVSAAIEVYRDQVDRRPGRDELDRMIARLPAEQLNDLGLLYEKEGRMEDAAWAYQHAVWRDPRYAQAYVNLGNVLREQGKLEEARLRYRQAMALDPDDFEAANNFADLCAEEGRLLDEAVERLAPLLDGAGPHRPFGLDTLGRLYHLRGEHERALAVLEEALEKAPSDQVALRATIHLHLAETYKALGRLAESESQEDAARRLREQREPARLASDDPESG